MFADYHTKMNISTEILIDIVCPMMKNMNDIIKVSLTCSTLMNMQDEMIKKTIEKHPFLKRYSYFLTNTFKISCSFVEFSKIINTLENKSHENDMRLHFLTNINQDKVQYKTSVKLYMVIQKYAKHLGRTTLYNLNILKFLLSMQYMFKKHHPGVCNISDPIFADAFLIKHTHIVSIENVDFDLYEIYENISILNKRCPRSYTLYENITKKETKTVMAMEYQIETIKVLSQMYKYALSPKIQAYINFEMFKYFNRILYSCDVANSTIFNNKSISQKFALTTYNKMLEFRNETVVFENKLFSKYMKNTIFAELQLFEKNIKIYI